MANASNSQPNKQWCLNVTRDLLQFIEKKMNVFNPVESCNNNNDNQTYSFRFSLFCISAVRVSYVVCGSAITHFGFVSMSSQIDFSYRHKTQIRFISLWFLLHLSFDHFFRCVYSTLPEDEERHDTFRTMIGCYCCCFCLTFWRFQSIRIDILLSTNTIF